MVCGSHSPNSTFGRLLTGWKWSWARGSNASSSSWSGVEARLFEQHRVGLRQQFEGGADEVGVRARGDSRRLEVQRDRADLLVRVVLGVRPRFEDRDRPVADVVVEERDRPGDEPVGLVPRRRPAAAPPRRRGRGRTAVNRSASGWWASRSAWCARYAAGSRPSAASRTAAGLGRCRGTRRPRTLPVRRGRARASRRTACPRGRVAARRAGTPTASARPFWNLGSGRPSEKFR